MSKKYCRAEEFLKVKCCLTPKWVWDPGDGRRVGLCTKHRDILVKVNDFWFLRHPYVPGIDQTDIAWLRENIGRFKKYIVKRGPSGGVWMIRKGVVVRDMEFGNNIGFSHIVYRLSDGKVVEVHERTLPEGPTGAALEAVADILAGGAEVATRYFGWPAQVPLADRRAVAGLIEELLSK